VCAAKRHPGEQHHLEPLVERLELGIANEVDHVEAVELGQDPPDKLAADPLSPAVWEHLEQRDERAQDAVADGGDEADDRPHSAVAREDDRMAAAQDLQVPLGGQRRRPVGEEASNVCCGQAADVGRVDDVGGGHQAREM